MPLPEPRCGKPPSAMQLRPGSPERLTWPKAKCSWDTTALTMACAGPSSPTTQRRAKKPGASGLCRATHPILMADLMIDGEKRHVAMTVPKNGFFYVLDAKTGKLISAKPLVNVAWAKSIDLQTGKPVEIPRSKGGGRQWTVHNWWPMSFNSQTGLVYVPATDRQEGTHTEVESGEWMRGTQGKLIAWDPVGQSARWTVEEPIATNGGVLST